MRAVRPGHLVILYLITLTILDEDKLRSCSLFSFISPLVAPSS
jgi:hypothetical protein